MLNESAIIVTRILPFYSKMGNYKGVGGEVGAGDPGGNNSDTDCNLGGSLINLTVG